MKRSTLKQFFFLLVLALSAIFFSVFFSITALAQADININNTNIIRFGNDVIVAPNQSVKNAIAIGGTVRIQQGTQVTNTAIAIDGDVILEKGARVDGDVYVVGGKIITEEGATIDGASGTILENGRWGMYGFRKRRGFISSYLFNTAFHLLNILISTIVGVLIILWRPNFLLNLAATVSHYPIQSGLWGLGGLFAVIVLIIVLAISLIGIPLLPLVALVFMITVLLGTLGVALWLGQRTLTTRERSLIQKFLIGMLILSLIGLIPVLGNLVLLVVNILGFGALLAWWFGNIRVQTGD
ncbi:MAG: polymer-forming cytoskeletal protein [Fischerella sp.]|nr:polymer-forming cytoskeletal protein [Fischerella sp.]